MAQVLLPQRPKDQLTALSQALNIAGSVYGIAGAYKQFDALSRSLEEKESLADPMSEQSKQARAQAKSLGLKDISETMSAADIQKSYGSFPEIRKQQAAEKIAGLQRTQKKEQEQVKLAENYRTKIEKIDKDFTPFERLYGSIDQLEEKFNAGKLNPQDRQQLIRLLVPLTEINPGVVRGEEVSVVNAQQSRLNRVSGFFQGELTGKQMTDTVAKELFDTARSLKPVVSNIKFDRVSDVANLAERRGLGEDIPFILGNKNRALLENQDAFAVFKGKQSSKEQQFLAEKPTAADENLLNELLQLDIGVIDKELQNRSVSENQIPFRR